MKLPFPIPLYGTVWLDAGLWLILALALAPFTPQHRSSITGPKWIYQGKSR